MIKGPLFPPIEPYQRGRLPVSPTHEIYFEVSGAPDGLPVVVCHGGPGGGSTPSMRRYFDPARYRVILFDQRGCGRSTPHASLEDNTTWHLVSDMEALRTHLGVEQWVVFGGSWGSTLAMTYALSHREAVMALVLRGLFTLRRRELDWFYGEGASWLFPDAWEAFLAPIPEDERSDLIAAYHRRLVGDDQEIQLQAAKAWSVWEGTTIAVRPSKSRVESFRNDHFALAFARIEAHYFINGGFFERDGWLLDEVHRLGDLPGLLVQGRYDVVTPPKTAFEIASKWPGAELTIVPDAGHAASDPGIAAALVSATSKIARQFG